MRGLCSHAIEKNEGLLYTNAAVMIGVKPWLCGVVDDDSHTSAEEVVTHLNSHYGSFVSFVASATLLPLLHLLHTAITVLLLHHALGYRLHS